MPRPETNHPTNKLLRNSCGATCTSQAAPHESTQRLVRLQLWHQRKSVAPTLRANIVVDRISNDHTFCVNPKRLSIIDVTWRIELMYFAVGITYKAMTMPRRIDVDAHDLTEYVEIDGKRPRIRTRCRTAVRRVETGYLAIQLACKSVE